MRANPKRAVSVKIGDFPRRDQDLLRAAFHALVPMVLVGFKDEKPFVISLGHPDGLTTPVESPEGSKVFSLSRIKGADKPARAPMRPLEMNRYRYRIFYLPTLYGGSPLPDEKVRERLSDFARVAQDEIALRGKDQGATATLAPEPGSAVAWILTVETSLAEDSTGTLVDNALRRLQLAGKRL